MSVPNHAGTDNAVAGERPACQVEIIEEVVDAPPRSWIEVRGIVVLRRCPRGHPLIRNQCGRVAAIAGPVILVAATVLLALAWFSLMYLFGTGRTSMAWSMLAMVAAFAILLAVVFSAEGPFAQGGWLGLAIFVPIGAVMAYFLLFMAKLWVARWYPHWRVKR